MSVTSVLHPVENHRFTTHRRPTIDVLAANLLLELMKPAAALQKGTKVQLFSPDSFLLTEEPNGDILVRAGSAYVLIQQPGTDDYMHMTIFQAHPNYDNPSSDLPAIRSAIARTMYPAYMLQSKTTP